MPLELKDTPPYYTINDTLNPVTPSYKLYTAILTQTSTNPPTATIIYNTVGTIVWTRNNVGDYIGTLSNTFTLTKTTVLTGKHADDTTLICEAGPTSDDVIQIYNYADGDGTLSDGMKIFIEIKIYQ